MKVICFDFDDVVISGNFLTWIAARFGKKIDEIRIFNEYLSEKDNPEKFELTVKRLVMLGKGMRYEALKRLMLKLKITKGFENTAKELNKRGYKISIISTNDEGLIRNVLVHHKLDRYIDHIYASRLELADGKVTGKLFSDVVKTRKKGIVSRIKKKYKISENDIIYVGDGLTDIPIMKLVGTAILFRPKTEIKAHAMSDSALMEMKRSSRFFIASKMSSILKLVA